MIESPQVIPAAAGREFSADNLFTRVSGLPAELPDNRYLPWVPNNGRKVPVNRRGERCNANDPRNWMSLVEARARSMVIGDSGPRVGLALRDSGLTVLDFDRVIDQDSGEIAPDVSRYLDLFGSYSELSQSGAGVHIIVEGDHGIGNRRMPGLELLTSGFLAITGHPLGGLHIVPGGAALTTLVDALRVNRRSVSAGTTKLPTVLSKDVQDLVARAWPNLRFQQLWGGDAEDYPSLSEADAALCMHLARNGGHVPEIIEALRQSGLRREKLERDDYCLRTALYACTSAVQALPRTFRLERILAHSDVAVAERWLRASPLVRDARLLIRLAAQIASSDWEERSPGFVRVTPELVGGDYDGSSERIMSRVGAWKALNRLADQGVFVLRTEVGPVAIKGKPSRGKVTAVQVARADFLGIITDFLLTTGYTPHCVSSVNWERSS